MCFIFIAFNFYIQLYSIEYSIMLNFQVNLHVKPPGIFKDRSEVIKKLTLCELTSAFQALLILH